MWRASAGLSSVYGRRSGGEGEDGLCYLICSSNAYTNLSEQVASPAEEDGIPAAARYFNINASQGVVRL